MNPLEPSLQRFANPLARYAAATRPAFLSVTLAGALIGLGSASADGLSIDGVKALITVLFALVAHAGANVVNDYYDALNGSDAGNPSRLFPFTGGSRFIQNGVLSLRETRRYGFGLLAAVVPAGLWLTAHSAGGLVWIGLAGLLVAWAYSAPPLQLMARGAGEAAIVAGWLLVVLGTDFVQRGELAARPLVAGLPFALLVAAILYLNQFPDARAGAAAGKRTLVVRLGTRQARWGYVALAATAYLWLAAAVVLGVLPVACALGLLPAALSFKAGRQLLRDADRPGRLVPAIKATIAAANLQGLLMALALAL
ncbi:prenyltransferase [Polaromonas glacialis]|uniref:prenyltransferase n=1 Tax=Polaromonas glacialis TaxID=866564 RepID=UPI000495D224|nr:prenyltransferase [Polaromonas glacialis]